MKNRTYSISLALALAVVVLPSTWASTTSTPAGGSGLGFQAWGLRAGFTDGDDQFVGGAHFNFGEVADQWRFQPDVEIGTGDDVTSLIGTAPLLYRFQTASRMNPYAGAGVTLGYFDVDADPLDPAAEDSEFGVGARATGGIEWPRRDDQAFFVELSVGFGDVHDLQLVAAWTF
jgi:hypothetical protein